MKRWRNIQLNSINQSDSYMKARRRNVLTENGLIRLESIEQWVCIMTIMLQETLKCETVPSICQCRHIKRFAFKLKKLT